jgi:enoyl-CoA hydratase/carnithine racemase
VSGYTYRHVVVERHGPVGWLILNRPEIGNAWDAVMLDDLEQAWTELDRDPDVRVIVNAANGRLFCTGVDLTSIDTDRDAMRKHSRRTRDNKLQISAWHCGVWKPVIAAINGTCAGGGLHLVADADIVIASSNATFVDPHVSVGQAVAYEAITLLRKMPAEAVMRMALVGSGERITAQRAYELGMISQIVDPPERLREEAQALAEKVARNSPAAMRATKKALWGAFEDNLSAAIDKGAAHLTSMWGHPDQDEGPRAFVEKREPRWQPLTPETS